ncbi:hypothetical protein [Jannaschia donghaensis]|uniref:Uncharacterized protein n=1 Tax=Jannaschia donghaensis TaxID=420998 RepID=A0A0M6YHI7_9RHOB|nr:hypothetical protein [Jannaschia donghaensis]CTQ48727.1 hypothetical protein JDO7802_00732 [Jannaschia donghaensis]
MMPLLDEGVDVWRPVDVEKVGDGRLRVADQPYNTEVETWMFPPGSIVRFHYRAFAGDTDNERLTILPEEA